MLLSRPCSRSFVIGFVKFFGRDDRDESDGGGDIDRVYDVDRIDPSPWWCSVCYCYGYGQMARAWIFVTRCTRRFLGSRVYMRASGAIVCSKVKKRWPFTTEDVKRKLFLKRPTGKELIETLKGCGSGGIFAYGIMNTLWYSFGIIAGMYAITSGGATSLALIKPKLLPALAAVWAGSQATKLFRISSSIALAPVCDKILDRVNRRLNEKAAGRFSKSQTLFWT